MKKTEGRRKIWSFRHPVTRGVKTHEKQRVNWSTLLLTAATQHTNVLCAQPTLNSNPATSTSTYGRMGGSCLLKTPTQIRFTHRFDLLSPATLLTPAPLSGAGSYPPPYFLFLGLSIQLPGTSTLPGRQPDCSFLMGQMQQVVLQLLSIFSAPSLGWNPLWLWVQKKIFLE